MNRITKNIAFKYYGGKFKFLENLYNYFPHDFKHLIDLFAGSFVVSINYEKNVMRTANDVNEDVVNFFEVLRNSPDELINTLRLTPYAIDEYKNCIKKGYNQCDKIERARQFFVRARQSYNGIGTQKNNILWSLGKHHNKPQEWSNAINKLNAFAKRIQQNFQITNLDYNICIDKLDSEKAFFYCDPPYPKEVRPNHTNVYKYEFTTKDHEQLSEKLHNIKGKAMISSYKSDLYDNLYHGFNKKILSSNEIIYYNYDIKRYSELLFALH